MNSFCLIVSKEISEFFSKWVNLLMILIFNLILWLFLWVFPASSYLSYGFAEPSLYFNLVSYLLLFFVPAIVSSLISQEFNYGTIELYKSARFSWQKLVLSKLFAGICLATFILLLSSVHLYFVASLQFSDTDTFDLFQLGFSFLGYIMVIAVFAALSILASVIIEQNIGALAASIMLCFLIYYGFGFLAESLSSDNNIILFIQRIGIQYHQELIAKGIVRFSSLWYLLTLVMSANLISGYFLSKKSF